MSRLLLLRARLLLLRTLLSLGLYTGLLFSLPPAASAVSQTPGEYKITDYGARGDGHFDNAPLLNALLRRFPPQGGILCIPNGDFLLGSPLVIPSSFVTIRGQNRGWRSNVDARVAGLADPGGGSKLLLAPAARCGISVPLRPRLPDGRANRITGLAIRDLMIQGAGPALGQTGIAVAQDGDGLVIENVSCLNLQQGILVQAADASRISGCLIAECRNCLRLEGGKENMIVQCHLGGQPLGVTCLFIDEDHLLMTACDLFPDGASAVRLTAGTFCTISDCLISGYYTGLIEIDGHDNALLGDSIRALKRGAACAKDPAGRNGDWGLVRLRGDDNRFVASVLYSNQSSNDVRVHCVSGEGNRLSDLAISGSPSPRKIVIDGMSARNTCVLDCVTAEELTISGSSPQTIVLIPSPSSK